MPADGAEGGQIVRKGDFPVDNWARLLNGPDRAVSPDGGPMTFRQGHG